MSSTRTHILLARLAVTGASEANCIEVELAYNKGGHNYFTSASERRGLYLHVAPFERRGGMKIYGAFTGSKIMVQEAARISKKLMDTRPDADYLKEIIGYVLSENRLTLSELTIDEAIDAILTKEDMAA